MVLARHSTRLRVFLVIGCRLMAPLFLRAFRQATIDAEWLRTIPVLTSRVARVDRPRPGVIFLDMDLCEASAEEVLALLRNRFPQTALVALSSRLNTQSARLLGLGVPTINRRTDPLVLTNLARRLAPEGGNAARPIPSAAPPPTLEKPEERSAHFESVFQAYTLHRSLSSQQHRVLRFYLEGKCDKAIATACQCSEATVYEHWRRMARKAGGSMKADAIADFHLFLGGFPGAAVSSPPLDAEAADADPATVSSRRSFS